MSKLGYTQTTGTTGTTTFVSGTSNTGTLTTLSLDQENLLVSMGWIKPTTVTATTATTPVDTQAQALVDAQTLVDAAEAQAAADAAQTQALLDATGATGTVTVEPVN